MSCHQKQGKMEEFDGKEGRKMVVKTGDGHTAREKKKKVPSV